MKREIILTKDGSSSLYLPDKDEHYHSSHGAVQESKHVFIKNGLFQLIDKKSDLDILEVGFGTGLNAILTLANSVKFKKLIKYQAIEPYPLSMVEVKQLNYEKFIDTQLYDTNFEKLHSILFDQWQEIVPYFQFIKYKKALLDCSFDNKFDLIYYDAFGPKAHPEMWESKPLSQVVNSLKDDGIFVTYCVKGSVKRILKSLGLQVQKLPGPPGKREMMIASSSRC
mgnify:CR=1 FL=1